MPARVAIRSTRARRRTCPRRAAPRSPRGRRPRPRAGARPIRCPWRTAAHGSAMPDASRHGVLDDSVKRSSLTSDRRTASARHLPEEPPDGNTLLDLTSQGDVATISDESKLSSDHAHDPQQLYELWERQQWLSSQIDLTQDRADWQSASTDEEREQLVLVPVVVLHRRGAGHDAVLRPGHGLRVPAGGGLPHDPAGRRGAPRAALQPLLRAGRSATTATFEARLDARARGPQRRVHRCSSTRTWSRRATG